MSRAALTVSTWPSTGPVFSRHAWPNAANLSIASWTPCGEEVSASAASRASISGAE